MAVGQAKATIQAIKKEVTAGVYLPPSVGTDFIAIRPGAELALEPELVDNEELIGDIGISKKINVGEATTGANPAYLRHSGIEGQEPQTGIFWESLLGSKYIVATEQSAASSSTVSVVKVGSGLGASFRQGQALLVKKNGGFEVANIASISGDDLTLAFNLDSAPSVGTKLGKACLYIPTPTGHPTFSITKYLGNDYAIEASAGNTVTEAAITMDAKGLGNVEFSFAGTKYFYNPITVTATSKYLDVTDDTGTFSVSVEEKTYKTPVELAEAINASLSSASTETYTFSYSNTTGKFTIASGSTILSLLWLTGTNAANSIGTKLGFVVSADDAGAVTYTSDNAQVYSSSITPSYDSTDAIIVKGAELNIGTQEDNLCVCAQSVSVSISKEVEDINCVCEETGVKEKIATARTVTMEVVATMKKYDVELLSALIKNEGISAAMTCGPKSGGNFVGGKCFNVYMQKATVSAFTTSGESFLQVNFTLEGYVTSTEKDVYVNFI